MRFRNKQQFGYHLEWCLMVDQVISFDHHHILRDGQTRDCFTFEFQRTQTGTFRDGSILCINTTA